MLKPTRFCLFFIIPLLLITACLPNPVPTLTPLPPLANTATPTAVLAPSPTTARPTVPAPTAAPTVSPVPTLAGPPRRLNTGAIVKQDANWKVGDDNKLIVTNSQDLDAVVTLAQNNVPQIVFYLR